jgi:hypothetical protein
MRAPGIRARLVMRRGNERDRNAAAVGQRIAHVELDRLSQGFAGKGSLERVRQLDVHG